jgi:predicted O-methyltransferase YrrM
VALISKRPWSMVYIDGNHDYEIARKDWEACARSVKQDGIIVLDDAGLTTSFRPPGFATKGHPGPSRLAEEIDRKCFREILQVGHNRVFQKIAR